jgi:hypothetical protein
MRRPGVVRHPEVVHVSNNVGHSLSEIAMHGDSNEGFVNGLWACLHCSLASAAMCRER